MAMSKKQRRPLPLGSYRLVSEKMELLGVRVELNTRYFDIGLDEVSELFYGDLEILNKLPYIILRNVGGDFVSDDELNGVYPCHDISSFIEKNITVLTSFDSLSITSSSFSKDVISKFFTVKGIVENLRTYKGYPGSVMRTMNGLGILVTDISIKSMSVGKPMLLVSVAIAGNERKSDFFLSLLERHHIDKRKKLLFQEDAIVQLNIDHVEFLDILTNYRQSVFFNSLSPKINCYDANAINTITLYGSFQSGVLEFDASPEWTQRARKINQDLYDILMGYVLEIFNPNKVKLTHENLLLHVTNEWVDSGELKVQSLN